MAFQHNPFMSREKPLTQKNPKLKSDYSNDFHLHSHMLQIYNEEKEKWDQRMPQVIYKKLCVPRTAYLVPFQVVVLRESRTRTRIQNAELYPHLFSRPMVLGDSMLQY